MPNYSGKIRDRVLLRMMKSYEHDQIRKSEVISSLPVNVKSTLNDHKAKVLGTTGYNNITRDDYDPSVLLQKLQYGSDVIVLDSSTMLPDDWYELDWYSWFPELDKTNGAGGDGLSDAGGASSADGMTSDEETGASPRYPGSPLHHNLSGASGSLHDSIASSLGDSINMDELEKPKRVLVYTHRELLGLFARCRKGSVDGTFKRYLYRCLQSFEFDYLNIL